MKNLAVLVSNKGTGSNLKAIIDNGFKVKFVAADTEDAPGIRIAKKNKILAKVFPYIKQSEKTRDAYRDRYSKEIADELNKLSIKITVLAGFNRILTKKYFQVYKGITINIHPGAIPDKKTKPYIFPDGTKAPWNQGMMTEKAVANFIPLKYATSTIHIVTEDADFGPVLNRVIVPVKKNDTVENLYSRLKKAEHEGLLEVLKDKIKS